MQNFQDWEQVILTKPNTNINKNQCKNENKNKKFNDITITIKKPSITFQTAMQQGRVNNKMSQKDVALKMGVNINTIINYEKGKEIPTNLFISKLEKLFNMKMPRISKIKMLE